MLVVTGTSSTGKSRALYEALLGHDQIQAWPLVYPADPPQLLELLSEDLLASRIVLWLNDLEQYLLSPLGERIALGLRALLRNPELEPIAVVATLWPGHWETLTEEATSQSPDPYLPARRLLIYQAQRVHAAENFDSKSRQALLADETADPRMVEAIRLSGESGTVIQTLSGGPFLLDRYLHPDPDNPERAYSQAVLSAAIDARRLGLGPELPKPFLEHAARGYLAPEMRPDAPAEWVELGLRGASKKQRGVQALQLRRRPGDTDPLDAYRLHDFLAQYGGESRHEDLVPAGLWEAAAEPGRLTGAECLVLADAAHQRYLYGYAHRLYRLIPTEDSTEARSGWLRLLRDQGKLDMIRAEAARGDLSAHRILVQELMRQDRRSGSWPSAELRGACDSAVTAGCEDLREGLAEILATDGANEDAEKEYRRILAFDPEAEHARLQFIDLLIKRSQIEEAVNVARVHEQYSQDIYWGLVVRLLDSGRAEIAFPLIRSALDADELPDVASHHALADKLASAGGEELLRVLSAKGFRPATLTLNRITAQAADNETLAQRDDNDAREEQAKRLTAAHNDSELRRLAEQGDSSAAWHLTLQLEEQGKILDAISILRPWATATPSSPFGFLIADRRARKLVSLLEEAGHDEALHQLVTNGHGAFSRPLADWCHRHNHRADLEYLASRSNDGYVRKRLSWLLREAGDQAALQELAIRSKAGHRVLISSLIADGNTEELYRRVVLGDTYAQRFLENLIEQNDPRIPGTMLRRSGLQPDGRLATNALR
jgi:tetratricopeptide (TPR) repeat protein